jgi:hypothetical protein
VLGCEHPVNVRAAPRRQTILADALLSAAKILGKSRVSVTAGSSGCFTDGGFATLAILSVEIRSTVPMILGGGCPVNKSG